MTSTPANPSSPLNYGSPRQPAAHNPTLHLLAILTVCGTFPLIFMGGLVTSKGAGMAVPDWPNTFGYNMFLFPPSQWVGGVFYEHTHRLMGTVVGLLAVIMAGYAFFWQRRPLIRWMALAILGGVIFQGVLGGLRVVWINLDLAIVHACVAQAFFCLAGLMVLMTSRWWAQVAIQPERNVHVTRGIAFGACGVVVLVFLQLVVGALVRHYGAGLAIPDLPLAYGQIIPPTSQAGLDAANALRMRDPDLATVTLTQIWLHFGHRVGAVVVTIAIGVVAHLIARRYRREPALRIPSILISVLLLVQLTLGVLTVLYRKPADITSAHVAVGALVLLTAFVIAARVVRLYRLQGGELASPASSPAPTNLHPQPA